MSAHDAQHLAFALRAATLGLTERLLEVHFGAQPIQPRMLARTFLIRCAVVCGLIIAAGSVRADGGNAAPASSADPLEPLQWHGWRKDGTIITAAELRDMTASRGLRAILFKKRIPDPDLSEANLGGADLKRASLQRANLRKTILGPADLTEATLTNADLREADLEGTNLTGADLSHAKLGGANLYEAKMAGAIMIETDVSDVNFDLQPGTLPSIQYAATATGLEKMRYEHSPTSLIELREAFRAAGLREQANAVHFSIMHSRRKKAGFFEKILLLAVEIPCAYGMRPGRPLLILVSAILAFWIPYIFALNQNGMGGIWITWPDGRTPKDESSEKEARLSPRGFLRRIGVALYFSVVSAFNIGWEEINIGNWIAQLQPKEFALKATGWVRVIAGAQSLLGVYLVALSILSYFGHLFE